MKSIIISYKIENEVFSVVEIAIREITDSDEINENCFAINETGGLRFQTKEELGACLERLIKQEAFIPRRSRTRGYIETNHVEVFLSSPESNGWDEIVGPNAPDVQISSSVEEWLTED